jgi:hypothetical protein
VFGDAVPDAVIRLMIAEVISIPDPYSSSPFHVLTVSATIFKRRE